MKYIYLVALLSILLISCSRREEQNAVFTLTSGVTLEENHACSNDPIQRELTVKKLDKDYYINVSDFISCGGLEKPYLRQSSEKAVTLVIPSKHSTFFHSSCYCGRSLTIRLSNRAEPGDTLYVINDDTVLGHIILP